MNEQIRYQYINAVFNIDVEEFKRLLSTVPFDKELLINIEPEEEGCPLPIYWITQCWEIVYEHPEEWKDEYKDSITQKKHNNLIIKKIFEDDFGVKFEPIDFYNTDFWFYRNWRHDTFEDIFDCSKEVMLSQGYKELDLELYAAVCKFNFTEVKRLLELGADPLCEIVFDEYDEKATVGRIWPECCHLENELEHLILKNSKAYPLDDNARDLINLIGLAAHKTMFDLLVLYCKDDDENEDD